MTIETSYIAAFLIGLLGGVHCVGMCGGIVGALSFGLPEEKRHPTRSWTYLLAYNLARIISYTVAGMFVAGVVGFTLQLVTMHEVQTYLLILSGVFMILLGFYLAGWWRVLVRVEQAGAVIWRRLEPLGRRFLPVRTHRHAFLLGLIWGWLPCGLVYSVLIWALATGDAVQGGLLMLSFGLGTLPNLLAMGVLATSLNEFLRHAWVKQLAGSLIVILGSIQILQAL